MEIDKVSDTSETRGWLWGALILGIGLFGVADWLYGSMSELHRLLSGIGFLFLAPQAFQHPIIFTKPLVPQFKNMPRLTQPTNWLSIAGVTLLILALLIRWV